MKNYKDKRNGLIYCAVDKEHIKYFENNPNYIELKVEDKKPNLKKNKVKVEGSSTFKLLDEENNKKKEEK